MNHHALANRQVRKLRGLIVARHVRRRWRQLYIYQLAFFCFHGNGLRAQFLDCSDDVLFVAVRKCRRRECKRNQQCNPAEFHGFSPPLTYLIPRNPFPAPVRGEPACMERAAHCVQLVPPPQKARQLGPNGPLHRVAQLFVRRENHNQYKRSRRLPEDCTQSGERRPGACQPEPQPRDGQRNLHNRCPFVARSELPHSNVLNACHSSRVFGQVDVTSSAAEESRAESRDENRQHEGAQILSGGAAASPMVFPALRPRNPSLPVLPANPPVLWGCTVPSRGALPRSAKANAG